MADFKPGEAVEFAIEKFIEKSVPSKFYQNGQKSEKETCRNWKSSDMTTCMKQIVAQRSTSVGCRLPMTLNQGWNFNLFSQIEPLINPLYHGPVNLSEVRGQGGHLFDQVVVEYKFRLEKVVECN